jgi:hypothetical protein
MNPSLFATLFATTTDAPPPPRGAGPRWFLLCLLLLGAWYGVSGLVEYAHLGDRVRALLPDVGSPAQATVQIVSNDLAAILPAGPGGMES